MDKYLNIQCVKGLIISLDEQLYKYFNKDNLPENLKEKIINQYYDAILEQLDEEEDEKRKKFIIELHNRGIISENNKNELLNLTCENTGDETPKWVFNIIINGRRHVIRTPEENQIVDWEKIVLLSELAKTGEELLIVTYTDGIDEQTEGLLDLGKSVKVKEGMVFNVCDTLKGER